MKSRTVVILVVLGVVAVGLVLVAVVGVAAGLLWFTVRPSSPMPAPRPSVMWPTTPGSMQGSEEVTTPDVVATEMPSSATDAAPLKVAVSADGRITLDGNAVTLGQLAAKMAALKDSGGEVWYYRENPQGRPHPNAALVLELAAKNELDVRLFDKPGFPEDDVDTNAAPPMESPRSGGPFVK